MEDLHLTARHSLEVVARRTGLAPRLIRRLGFPGDHRWSDADVERLLMMARLRRLGMAPEALRDRSDDDLATLIALREAHSPEGTRTRILAAPTTPVLERALESLQSLESAELRRIFEASLASIGRSQLLHTLLIPLVDEIHRLEREGRLRPFHEHLAATCLATVLPTGDDPLPGPTLLLATPSGESHELELLVAAEVARTAGYRIRRLGTGVPILHLLAVGREESHPLLLTLSRPAVPGVLTEELSYLVARWRGGPLFFHGRGAADVAAAVERTLALRPPEPPAPAPIVVSTAAELGELLRTAQPGLDLPGRPQSPPVATLGSPS